MLNRGAVCSPKENLFDYADGPLDFTLTSQSDLSGDIDELNSVQPSASMSNEPTILTVVQDNQWKPLQDAIFHFRRGLTSRQVQFLQEIQDVPNADSVLVFTAHLDSRNRERKGSSIASRFYSALKSVRDFSAVIESSSCPKGLPVLLWASVKLTIKVRLER